VAETPLPLPAFTTWDTFPFEGDLKVRKLEAPVDHEPARKGEEIAECKACQAGDDAYIWVNERWRVRSMDRPTGLPMILILEPRSHLDLGDLPNLLAGELGVLSVRLERAIRSLDGVARVHVNRWGDGAAHLHVWFMARPHGQLQLRGSFLPMWDDILPPVNEAQWRENLALIAAWLEDFGGIAVAQPPKIEWQAPSRFSAEGEASTLALLSAGDAEDQTTEAIAADAAPPTQAATDAATGTAAAAPMVQAKAEQASTDPATTTQVTAKQAAAAEQGKPTAQEESGARATTA
jgi:hypothetical protein